MFIEAPTSFSTYLHHARKLIEAYRTDLTQIEANCPYEHYPSHPLRSGHRFKYGVLLIHGLLDCPFSLRDLSSRLQTNGIFSRSILLPGHGTTPSHLLDVTYQDWVRTVQYGVESLRDEVEHLYLVGYSTGAALSVYQALHDTGIDGIVLLSPAIKVKAPVDLAVSWYKFTKLFSKDYQQWIYQRAETDYAKYQSIPFNAVTQVNNLTNVVRKLIEAKPLTQPIYMIVSREDETISSQRAIEFFSEQQNPNSRLLLYTSSNQSYADTRIISRSGAYPSLGIKHISHIAVPFASNNPHYGTLGDYDHASRLNTDTIYGAYNPLEEDFFDKLYHLKLTKHKRRTLTYNPDFDFMANEVIKFITYQE